MYHLAEGVDIIRRIVLHDLPVISPGWHIAVTGEAVVWQMPRPAVSQIHDIVLIALVQAVGVFTFFQNVRSGGAVAEIDSPFDQPPFLLHDFEEMMIRVVYHQGWRPCEILMGPGISKHVHGDPCRLQTLVFRKSNSIRDQFSIGAADQAILAPVFSAAFDLSIEIPRQEMKR